jgi:hypothetical protein
MNSFITPPLVLNSFEKLGMAVNIARGWLPFVRFRKGGSEATQDDAVAVP